VVTVTVVAPLPVMEAGLKEHLLSAGKPEHVKLTALAKPGDAVMLRVVSPDSPAVTLIAGNTVGTQKSTVVIAKLTCGELLELKLGSPE
jgi:hypothetical protein